ncbi:placenta-specific gene 8 protein-like isoform X2 [Boleophthalmus pectinirostris]|uniref:placenta-specific gene 8 protein-like isoform X2 n=1 Tax=Boleophthalmus pectinirostris TaxID=150288 RepID=UPI0024306287|nr:placenta-specific gene 8 protein-like isoform X2 [Boleophthalmus pectinirostris]
MMSSRVVQVQPVSRVQESGEWSTGLCECYKDMGDCCCALCCLPVFTCRVTRALGVCPCLPLLDCLGCVPPASLAMRASVRERYGIKISRELKRRTAAHSSTSSSTSSSSSSPTTVRYTALRSLQGAHLV